MFGGHFETPILEEFIRLWINLFARSPHTRLPWKKLTGKAVASYSDTRWWSRWEVYNQVLLQFGDVLLFLQTHPEFSPVTTRELLQLFTNAQRLASLQIELATVVDCGESFMKATYNLKGNGPVIYKYYEILDALTEGIHTAHFPNLQAVARKLSAAQSTPGGSAAMLQQMIAYGKSRVQPGLDYFIWVFQQELSGSVCAFKAAQIFFPSKVRSRN